MDLTALPFPEINATLNGLATVLLTVGWLAIRQKQIALHRACMVSAFGVSAVFLVTYVVSKIVKGGLHTPFGGEGLWRTIYYTMLFSHIVLAILILPLILWALYLGWQRRDAQHRGVARVTFPLWYYVSVTGVLVYFFLYQWFPAGVVATPA